MRTNAVHLVSRQFSLVGRPIVLNTPYEGCTEGTIMGQIGPAHFVVHLPTIHYTVNMGRSEFSLPPLPYAVRHGGEYLEGDFDGFAYADSPGFVNPFARAK